MKTAPEILQLLQAQFPEKIVKSEMGVLDPWAVVEAGSIVEICTFLKNHNALAFDTLACLSGVDYKGLKGEAERLEVVYHLFSMKLRHKFVLKVELPRENPSIGTVEGIWAIANCTSGKRSTCSAFALKGTATCGVFFVQMIGKGIRCARITNSRKLIEVCPSSP